MVNTIVAIPKVGILLHVLSISTATLILSHFGAPLKRGATIIRVELRSATLTGCSAAKFPVAKTSASEK